ncbi:hypothetical protein C5708_18915 [Caulobacter sp. CCUG 60055]|nr:hypothetical protein [Caulobacter sp. CCUG 60055]
MMAGRKLLLCLVSVLALGAAQRAAAETVHRAGDVIMETRSVTAADGEVVPFELGTLFVPENRAVPGSRIIGVGFARIRSNRSGDSTPTVHLPGGPGETDMEPLFKTDPESQRDLTQLLQYRAIGDVLVIDQRGYSERGEVLNFAYHPIARPLDRPGSRAGETETFIEVAKAAVAANSGRDLSGYTVIQCAEDVNDLRRALGYEKIRLVGQSFGSQWGFAVLRTHPEIVQRALLSGVEPLDYAYDMPSQVFGALQRISWDAEHDAGLAPYMPPGGLVGAIRSVRERLLRAPVKVTLKDPKTGRVDVITLGAEDFQRAVIRPEGTRPPRAWPAFILSIYYGRYDDWAREVMQDRAGSKDEMGLIGPLIDTSLGVTPAREHLLRTDPAADLLGWWNFDFYIATASIWPSPDVGDDFRTPVLNPVPVLFVEGDWDISTPYENMLNMLPYFPNSRAILVHRGSHGARYAIFARQPQVMEAALRFLKTGETQALPVSVSLDVPKFQVPAFAPPARQP